MNNERINRIDDFLKMLCDIAIENPNYQFRYKDIYDLLHDINIPNDNYDVNQNDFNDWINHFKNNDGIDVFVSERWKYFCQFIGKSDNLLNYREHIKLYIPIDSNHINLATKQIFEFLTYNNIAHVSKISSEIRNDDIVIRLIDPNDAVKIINYVKNNNYIQEGLIKTNPFLYSESGVAIASDGKISFNDTICELLASYINEKKKNDMLASINAHDFYGYVEHIYNKIFVEKNEELIEKIFKSVKTPDCKYDIKGVMGILLKSIKDDYNLNKYFEIYSDLCNMFANMGKKVFGIESIKTNYEEIEDLFKFGVSVFEEKYGSFDGALVNIRKYIETDDLVYITRANNLRNVYSEKNYSEMLKKYLKENNLSFDEFAFKISNKTKEIENVGELLNSVVSTMNDKYGENVAKNNLVEYFNGGDKRLLTRDSNIREKVSSSDLKSKINKLTSKINGDVSSLLDSMLSSINTKEKCLNDACVSTYMKYDKKYSSGLTDYSGMVWVTSALKSLINENSYVGFTRDDGIRDNLKKHISREDAIKIISSSLNISPIEVDNIAINEYLDKILNQVIAKKI